MLNFSSSPEDDWQEIYRQRQIDRVADQISMARYANSGCTHIFCKPSKLSLNFSVKPAISYEEDTFILMKLETERTTKMGDAGR